MLKRLLQSVREYKKHAVLAPVYVTIESVLEIFIPTVMSFLIDNGIQKNNMPYIFRIGFILVVLAGFSMLTGLLSGRSSAIAGAGFAKNLRRDIFHSVQQFSFSNIDKFSTAGIITRLTTDVTNVQMAFQMIIRLGVRAPMMILFALIFSFRISPRLALIFLAVIPILGIGLWLIITKVHPIFVKVFNTYDKLNNVVQENLHGIRVVKSYTREDYEQKKFSDISYEIFKNFSSAGRRLSLNTPLMQFCLYASMILLSWFGARQIIASGNNAALGLTTGQLTSLVTYSMQILMSLMMLSNVFVMIIISRASTQRIVEILEEESDLKNPENPVLNVPDGSITFENVRFMYSRKADKPVLNNINLTINSGETVGIIGGTGSSKSSLVQLIARLYDVLDGKVCVGGVDVKDYDLETLRNNVAMVLQKNILFSGTIKENLKWGNEKATDQQIAHACQLAQAEAFINEFPQKYDTYIEQGGSNVSGGQCQRLCIARALLKNPSILILDDSTSAVDTATDSKIRQAFKEEIPHITKIIIAQRVLSVKEADKIIVLDDGEVNAIGTHEELLQSCDIYREVYESQNRGGVLHE